MDRRGNLSFLRVMNNSYFCLVALCILVLEFSSLTAISQSTVKYLPGFEGPLPFELETGYVGVDESEVQLFYYFVKSENNPTKDPLILWSTGGPGCSSFYAFVYEVGPLNFRPVKYNGSLPTLVLNPNSWTKTANIIFLDLPVGTGFSYSTTSRASVTGDIQASHQAYLFLQKWLIDHPEYISNPVYISGNSYSGLTVPQITQVVSDGNEVKTNQYINLQGYTLGNPATNYPEEKNYEIPFAHRMGLISDELYQSLVKCCRGEYQNINPNNLECLAYVAAYKKCVRYINTEHILEPYVDDGAAYPRRSLSDNFIKFRDGNHQPSSSLFTRVDIHRFSEYWMNDQSVQTALHVRNRTVKEWLRCNYSIPYTYGVNDTRPYHLSLSKRSYRSLIYSGDHDMSEPYMSTEAWIRNLNYSIVDDWRSWFTDDEEVAGYTRTYSNKMTFATIKGAGHTAVEYKPAEGFVMFKRWIFGEPL